jgi:pyruvate formate lyase activating enzyme
MNGQITTIQRFSLNDGPGIRTTVFFKGCNLRCAWCHNPETFSFENDVMYDPGKCIGCMHCVSACPTGAQQTIDGRHVFDRDLCTNCGACAEVCFPEALQNTAHTVSCDAVMKEVLQDKPYYLDSGGGVTLSGGEAMLQADFAKEIVIACKANHISCGVETNLAYELDKAEDVLRMFDLIMFDLKIMDSDEHAKWTGSGNAQILENVRILDGYGIPLIARTPLIPGASDAIENLKATVAFLAKLNNLRYYEILNFNPLGEAKYRGLSINNTFDRHRPFSDEHLEMLKNELSGLGVEIRLG